MYYTDWIKIQTSGRSRQTAFESVRTISMLRRVNVDIYQICFVLMWWPFVGHSHVDPIESLSLLTQFRATPSVLENEFGRWKVHRDFFPNFRFNFTEIFLFFKKCIICEFSVTRCCYHPMATQNIFRRFPIQLVDGAAKFVMWKVRTMETEFIVWYTKTDTVQCRRFCSHFRELSPVFTAKL